MGLFDNLFKSKPTLDDEAVVEAARRITETEKARLVEAEKASKPAESKPPASGNRAAHAPVARAYSPRSLGQTVPPARPPLTGRGPSKGVRFGAGAEGGRPQEIRLLLDDVLPRIPPDLLNDNPRDVEKEIRFRVEDVTADIARGRAAVALARIAEQAPEIFRSPIAPDDETLIRLPLQKLVEQIGFLPVKPATDHKAPHPHAVPTLGLLKGSTPASPPIPPIPIQPKPAISPVVPVLPEVGGLNKVGQPAVETAAGQAPLSEREPATAPAAAATAAPLAKAESPPKGAPVPTADPTVSAAPALEGAAPSTPAPAPTVGLAPTTAPVQKSAPAPASKVVPTPIAAPTPAPEAPGKPTAPAPAIEAAPSADLPPTFEHEPVTGAPIRESEGLKRKMSKPPGLEFHSTAIPADAKISLSLAAVLRDCPKELICAPLPPISDEDRISVTFASIERQLQTGQVEISSVRFVFALPLHLQHCFEAREGIRIPLPLDEVMRNLPGKPRVSPAPTAAIPTTAAIAEETSKAGASTPVLGYREPPPEEIASSVPSEEMTEHSSVDSSLSVTDPVSPEKLSETAQSGEVPTDEITSESARSEPTAGETPTAGSVSKIDAVASVSPKESIENTSDLTALPEPAVVTDASAELPSGESEHDTAAGDLPSPPEVPASPLTLPEGLETTITESSVTSSEPVAPELNVAPPEELQTLSRSDVFLPVLAPAAQSEDLSLPPQNQPSGTIDAPSVEAGLELPPPELPNRGIALSIPESVLATRIETQLGPDVSTSSFNLDPPEMGLPLPDVALPLSFSPLPPPVPPVIAGILPPPVFAAARSIEAEPADSSSGLTGQAVVESAPAVPVPRLVPPPVQLPPFASPAPPAEPLQSTIIPQRAEGPAQSEYPAAIEPPPLPRRDAFASPFVAPPIFPVPPPILSAGGPPATRDIPHIDPPPSPILPVRMVSMPALRPIVAPPPLFGVGVGEGEPVPEHHTPLPAEVPPEPEPPPPPPPPPRPLDLARTCEALGLSADGTLSSVGEAITHLPGMYACLLTVRHEVADIGTMSDGFNPAETRALAARLAESLSSHQSFGAVQHLTVFTDHGCLSVFARGTAVICALHRTRAFLPGVCEKLGAAAEALAEA